MAEPGADDPLSEEEGENDEVIPVDTSRRRAAWTVGCVLVLIILGVLVWFGVTHTEIGNRRHLLGAREQQEGRAAGAAVLPASGASALSGRS